MALRIVDKKLVITKKVKPKKGDFMCCFATGMKIHKTGEVFGRGHYLTYHDDKPTSRLNAICDGAEKVVFMINFKK